MIFSLAELHITERQSNLINKLFQIHLTMQCNCLPGINIFNPLKLQIGLNGNLCLINIHTQISDTSDIYYVN